MIDVRHTSDFSHLFFYHISRYLIFTSMMGLVLFLINRSLRSSKSKKRKQAQSNQSQQQHRKREHASTRSRS